MHYFRHWSLVLLVYVLKIDVFQLALILHYREEGMGDEATAIHMESLRRKVFLITAAACVAAMALGYAVSRLFEGSAIGKLGW
jgi:hypothetical protein